MELKKFPDVGPPTEEDLQWWQDQMEFYMAAAPPEVRRDEDTWVSWACDKTGELLKHRTPRTERLLRHFAREGLVQHLNKHLQWVAEQQLGQALTEIEETIFWRKLESGPIPDAFAAIGLAVPERLWDGLTELDAEDPTP